MSAIAQATRPLVDQTLSLLHDWTTLRSTADNTAGRRQMARALTAFLRDELGAAIIEPGETRDLIHARIDRGLPVTLLLYNMYDVMPASAEGWVLDPFVGGIVDLPGIGTSFVGRGAENNKGPLAGMLAMLRDLVQRDALPANIEIILDGQEETGSADLRTYLRNGTVARAGAAFFPSFCEYGGAPPRIFLGSKGIARGTIVARGGPSGGPTAPIHSSNSPWIANPAWRLVHLLATLAPDSTGALGRTAPTQQTCDLISTLADQFDPQRELQIRKSERYAIDGTTEDRVTALLMSANLNISSIVTDRTADSGVIPPSAQVAWDLRCPPNRDPEAMVADIRQKIADFGPDITLTHDSGYAGATFRSDHPAVIALTQTYEDFGIAPQIWPWTVGAMPCGLFQDVTDIFLLGGLGHGGHAHAANEFVTLEGLARFMTSLSVWIDRTARALLAVRAS
ncbi:peptidase M20 [Neoasaia chiangmaiensis NBRC 101099]|uniref:Uncharacterized protein n=1 Tax=Neoasaia chiangmaiensis TaxID=320497 RepID=A0A1U9KLL3_9PROT|nr:M20/M25/M40 family metallo-hydrolase [Neoasaia chiangmaiensis]AQS86677.1 hypothetical protein A0U93_00500 [Neoasaia chiangmaiensis]GBR35785.1 peptidase M20 [Neoasaia chiangmaiensis NBRC 101099]GEN16653.1 hypothetical protein NCH01_30840 [Neoasaia chiangmaiensis]